MGRVNLFGEYCHSNEGQMAFDNSQRIMTRLKELGYYVDMKGYDLSNIPQEKSPIRVSMNTHKRTICSDHIHCPCSKCSSIAQQVYDLNEQIAERVIQYHFLLIHVKNKDKECYGKVKYDLMRLLGGHFPNAASIINAI